MIKGKSGGQLSMFMTPREVHSMVDRYADLGPATGNSIADTPAGIRGYLPGSKRKPRAISAKGDTLAKSGMGESIRSEGVKKPLSIKHDRDQTYLANGHHRVIAQTEADPDRLMPVEHFDSTTTVDTYSDTQLSDPTGDAPRVFGNGSARKVKTHDAFGKPLAVTEPE